MWGKDPNYYPKHCTYCSLHSLNKLLRECTVVSEKINVQGATPIQFSSHSLFFVISIYLNVFIPSMLLEISRLVFIPFNKSVRESGIK